MTRTTTIVEPALERIVVALRAAGATVTPAQATKAAKILEPSTLEEVGQARARVREVERALTGRAVAAVIAAVDEGAALRPTAKAAGVSYQTVYNELERRAKAVEHTDQLEGNGHPPAPAPHDQDPAAASEPTVRLSPTMRDALAKVAAGTIRVTDHGDIRSSGAGAWPSWSTLEALERRGVIGSVTFGTTVKLTRAGRELVERGGAS